MIESPLTPLAEKYRPQKLDDLVGQDKIVRIIKPLLNANQAISIILWGPAGTGKTSLARIIANTLDADCVELSAVIAKKADIEQVIERARKNWNFKKRTLLFVDEIHRFNKAQQDAFLPHVESGLISLIGATTENPSFEVIAPLLSRSRVLTLDRLDEHALIKIINRALNGEQATKKFDKDLVQLVARMSSGDARRALGIIECALNMSGGQPITKDLLEQASGHPMAYYDKSGDNHYNLISAYIKSLRGSDAEAALYYLARMIKAGEDIKFIARRLLIFASEDIGLAGNGAIGLANNAFSAVERTGLPEAGIILAHVTVAFAKSAKSRSSYDDWRMAEQLADQFPSSEVPLKLRNPSTKLMKNLGYGKDYTWAAGWHGNFDYLPPEVRTALNKAKATNKPDKTIRPD